MNRAFDLVKAVTHRVGLDVRHHRPASGRRAALLARHGVRTVLDVGANIGQYGQELRDHGFDGDVISFEPLPDAYAELAATAAADPRWTALPLGAADAAGTAQIHRAAASPSSSLLPMAQAHLDAAPQTATVGTVEIALVRLDECAEVLAAPDPMLLKLDVQGFEQTALSGSIAILDRVVLIEVELSVRELYIGAPTMLEMMTDLHGRGFELIALEEGFHDPRDGAVLQYDGYFIRSAR